MKKLLFVSTLLLCTLISYSQNNSDKPITVLNTNKMSASGMVASSKYNFKIYNDSLIMEYIGGMGYNKAVKKGLPLKTIHKIKCKVEALGNINSYLYQNEKISIRITQDNTKVSVLFRTKDNFSGQVTEILYYTGL